MPSLFVIQGRDQGRRYELDQHALKLGRDASVEIQLNDTEVSRQHAEVRSVNGTVQLVDLESSNGTFLNGNRTTEAMLESGDRIQIGRTLMIFTGSQSPTAITSHVDIVRSREGDSRIISSIAPSDDRIYAEGDESESSPWLARARSNLQIMYRTALAVSHTMDIDQLLGKIMDLIFEWVAADRGCVMLVNRETGELEVKVRRDRKDSADAPTMQISQTILDFVQEKQEGVLTSDARQDQRFDAAGSIITMGVREAICVPMQGRYGNVGLIYIDTFTSPSRALEQNLANRFTEDHLKLMIAIGHQAALAIEDTSYYSAMVQAERLAAIGQTIAGLSHHIKNILQGIRGGSYLIEEGLKDDDSDVTTRGWRIVEKNQEKISVLVMDMLTFSKDRQPEMVESDLNCIVGDVIELMQVRSMECAVQVLDQRQSTIPVMIFDGDGLHRAILNVLTNAIDACHDVEQGQVTIGTNYDESLHELSVEIQDNGPGIAEEDLQKIFGLFESGKGNRGTGLGLPVSQKILREHQGDIHVSSELNVGTKFILRWPATPPEKRQSRHKTGVIDLNDLD